jgi:O-antigen/teichoic acid export membrane protein
MAGALSTINSIDLGLGIGLQRRLAQGFGTESDASMRQAFSSGVLLLAALSAVFTGLGIATVCLLPVADWLHIESESTRLATPAALTAMMSVYALGIPANAAVRLASATQLGWIASLWVAAGSLISLAIVILAASLKLSLPAFAAASMIAPAMQNFGLWLQMTRRLHWPFFPPERLAPGELRLMLRESLLYSIPQLGTTLLLSLPVLAMSVQEGAATATHFSLLYRLFSPLLAVQLLLLNPLVPAYTEAQARGDLRWITKTWKRSLWFSAALATLLLPLAWQSRRLLAWWITTECPPPDPALTCFTALFCCLLMFCQPLLSLLSGLGRFKDLVVNVSPGLLLATLALFLPWPATRPAIIALEASCLILSIALIRSLLIKGKQR